MYQITNHKEIALNTCLPYLHDFNGIYELLNITGNRVQSIEDVLWKVLYSLDVDSAEGIWLDYLGKKLQQSRVYAPIIEDAFTFGGTVQQGFGAGKFQSSSRIGSSKLSRSDSNYRSALKAKVIENNTNSSINDIISACKLLYNASIVNVAESYPANIPSIKLYGSKMILDANAPQEMRKLISAGVSLGSISFYQFYNIFKNNAFISYDSILPSGDDWELSFILQPETLSEDSNTAILSQGITWSDPESSIRLYYSPEDGIVFRTSANQYNDNSLTYTTYNDELMQVYVDGGAGVYLAGGEGLIVPNAQTAISITKVGNIWSLYINDNLIAYTESDTELEVAKSDKLFLGVSNGVYYNSGSIYNLALKNLTTDEVILNDPLMSNTIGKNNGVIFI